MSSTSVITAHILFLSFTLKSHSKHKRETESLKFHLKIRFVHFSKPFCEHSITVHVSDIELKLQMEQLYSYLICTCTLINKLIHVDKQ